MSTASITSVLRELYSAPLDAVVQAEEDYRRIWSDWLRNKLEFVQELNKLDAERITSLLETAPVVRLDGRIDISITMRIASVRGVEVSGTAGLALGPIHVGGTFGFVNRTTQESVLQASTVVVLSNTDQSLTEYLAKNNIPVTSADELRNAVKLLGGGGE